MFALKHEVQFPLNCTIINKFKTHTDQICELFFAFNVLRGLQPNATLSHVKSLPFFKLRAQKSVYQLRPQKPNMD